MRRRLNHKPLLRSGLAAAVALLTATQAGAIVTHKPKPADLTQGVTGFFYYNRPGASMAEHDADLAECRRAAAANAPATGVPTVDPMNPQAYTAGGAGASLLLGISDAAIATAYRQARVQWCMVALGWRVVALDAKASERMAALHQEKLAIRLAPMVSAATPPGRIVASFRNQAASAETVRFQGANNNDQTSFSTRAMVKPEGDDARTWRIAAVGLPSSPGGRPAEAPGAGNVGTGLAPDPQPGILWNRREIPPPPPLAATPDGMATVLVRIVGDAKRAQQGIQFDPVGIADAGPFGVRVPRKAKDQPMERTLAVHVAPGRYRLGALLGPQAFAPITVDLCLGSPSFEIAAGEVVFLGSFDMVHDLTPDPALEPARAYMAGVEVLKGRTGELKAASWTNGSTGVCGGTYFYALEFPGAPFAPGYAWGSRAQP